MRSLSMHPALAVFCALGVVLPTFAAELHLDFERPTYRDTSLSGQDGWLVVNSTSVVGAGYPTIGQQSVELINYGLAGYRPIEPAIPATEVRWSWYLDGQTSIPNGNLQWIVFANAQSNVEIVSVARDDDTLNVRWGGSSPSIVDLGRDMPWDRWVNFRVVIDRATLAASLYIDNEWAYTYTAPSDEIGYLYILGSQVTTAGDQMYMDEVHVVPEPAAWLLAGVATFALRRR